MTPEPSDVFVIVPDPSGYGFSVVAVGDLYDRLGNGEESLDECIANTAIDTVDPTNGEHLERIRKLNETGNADAYWRM